MVFETVPKDPNSHEQFISVYEGGYYINAEVVDEMDIDDAKGVVVLVDSDTGTLRFEFVDKEPTVDNDVRPFSVRGGIHFGGSTPRQSLGVYVSETIRVSPDELAENYVEIDLSDYR